MASNAVEQLQFAADSVAPLQLKPTECTLVIFLILQKFFHAFRPTMKFHHQELSGRIQALWYNVMSSGVPRNFFRGRGGSTNSVEDRVNGDLGAVTPSQGFWRQL